MGRKILIGLGEVIVLVVVVIATVFICFSSAFGLGEQNPNSYFPLPAGGRLEYALVPSSFSETIDGNIVEINFSNITVTSPSSGKREITYSCSGTANQTPFSGIYKGTMTYVEDGQTIKLASATNYITLTAEGETAVISFDVTYAPAYPDIVSHENPQVGDSSTITTTATITGYIQIPGNPRQDIDIQQEFSVTTKITAQESITTSAGTFNTFKNVITLVYDGNVDTVTWYVAKGIGPVRMEGEPDINNFYAFTTKPTIDLKSTNFAPIGRIDKAIAWASKKMEIGDKNYSGWCLKFVQDAYEYTLPEDNTVTRYGYPKEAVDSGELEVINNETPPCGAYVFYEWWGTVEGEYRNWGHVGISLGNGQIIHAWNVIKKENYLDLASTIEKHNLEEGKPGEGYIGWAKPPLNPPIEKGEDISIQVSNENTSAAVFATEGNSLLASSFVPSTSPPFGETLIGIRLNLINLMEKSVDFILDFVNLPSNATFYKYNPDTGQYTDISSLITRPEGGTLISWPITDGGTYDYDGATDGSIYDPIVITVPASSLAAAGGGGGGGGCFIATAVYGTPMAEEVKTLSKFRDEVLLRTPAGREFVKFYYIFSPPIADFIRNKPGLKAMVREALKLLVEK